MAFKLERFDIIKQNYDGTGLFFYHDTVGTAGDGNTLAQIVANNFFNTVKDELLAVGSIIIITATDGASVVRVTQLESAGAAAVTVAKISATAG